MPRVFLWANWVPSVGSNAARLYFFDVEEDIHGENDLMSAMATSSVVQTDDTPYYRGVFACDHFLDG